MTKRQHDFCIAYVVCRNPKEACIIAGYTEAYSKTKSYALLKKPAIKDKITTLSESYYKEQFQELATKSIKELAGVIEDVENRSSQLKAIQYVLSQAGVAEQDDKQTGVIEIKVRLPHDLQH